MFFTLKFLILSLFAFDILAGSEKAKEGEQINCQSGFEIKSTYISDTETSTVRCSKGDICLKINAKFPIQVSSTTVVVHGMFSSCIGRSECIAKTCEEMKKHVRMSPKVSSVVNVDISGASFCQMKCCDTDLCNIEKMSAITEYTYGVSESKIKSEAETPISSAIKSSTKTKHGINKRSLESMIPKTDAMTSANLAEAVTSMMKETGIESGSGLDIENPPSTATTTTMVETDIILSSITKSTIESTDSLNWMKDDKSAMSSTKTTSKQDSSIKPLSSTTATTELRTPIKTDTESSSLLTPGMSQSMTKSWTPPTTIQHNNMNRTEPVTLESSTILTTTNESTAHVNATVSSACPFPSKYSDCASACQPSCDERDPEICTLQCIDDPCICMEGFIRRSKSNRTCIPENECDSICKSGKVMSKCAPVCPPTCSDPFPNCTTDVCNEDPCICGEGYVLKSKEDQRCIRSYECEDFSYCTKDCPSLSTPCNKSAAWSCLLSNWKCSIYQWKVEMDKWWQENECSNSKYPSIWNYPDFKVECPDIEISCKFANASECYVDMLGCTSCVCIDGEYTDPDQLQVVWLQTQEIFQKYVNLSDQAHQICLAANDC